MKTSKFFNKTKNVVLCTHGQIADNFFTRLKGLLGSKDLPSDHGLFLRPCNQIHMFGMAYAIDAIFLDGAGVVVGLVERIAPGKLSKAFGKAKGCLELPAGTISDTKTELGDVVEQV